MEECCQMYLSTFGRCGITIAPAFDGGKTSCFLSREAERCPILSRETKLFMYMICVNINS